MRNKYAITTLITIIMLFILSGCGFHHIRGMGFKHGPNSNKMFCSTEKNPDGKTMISGQVFAPLEKAAIYVYREGDDLYGPPYSTSDYSDKNGNFSLELPPGEYYIVARYRKSGSKMGPLREGDLKSEILGPFTIKEGRTLSTNLYCQLKTDDKELYSTPGSTKSDTSFSGRISDVEGKPVPNVRVHIYKYIQMSERPKFVSAATGHDGKYTVFLPKGGTYYICARDSFGGPPKLGDLYGRYDGGAINPSALVINNGEKLKEIDITVQRVW